MKRNLLRVFAALGVIGLMATACQRPATVLPAATPTTTSDAIPFPVATQPQIMADILKQTQTAMALSTEESSFPFIATSTPAFVFETPSSDSTPFMDGTQPVGGELPPIGTPATPTAAPLVTATPTQFTYPTPTPGRPATYAIQAGEYLWCLARRFDVSIDAIYALNGMNAASQPSIGTIIKIPDSGSFGGTRARYPHPTTYTVKAGDTIGGIACSYGDVDPNTVYAANGLAPGSIIVVGQVLQIP